MVGRSSRVCSLASNPHKPSCRPTFSGASFHPSDPRLSFRYRWASLVGGFCGKGAFFFGFMICTLTSNGNATLKSNLHYDFEWLASWLAFWYSTPSTKVTERMVHRVLWWVEGCLDFYKGFRDFIPPQPYLSELYRIWKMPPSYYSIA